MRCDRCFLRIGMASRFFAGWAKSISLDWAMFISCGVRSYFAKPFYSAEGVHVVLISAFAVPSPEVSAMSPSARFMSRLRVLWCGGGPGRGRKGRLLSDGENPYVFAPHED